MMSLKYFTALELVNPPAWPTPEDYHPHITLHYFGGLPNAVAASIKNALALYELTTVILEPRAIERFGKGWALTFGPTLDLSNVVDLREKLAEHSSFIDRIDQTYPDFRAHLSLPNVVELSTGLLEPLKFGPPVLLATKSVVVRP